MYDPSYFIEREQFIARCRDFVETEDYVSEDWRKLSRLVMDLYEQTVEFLRLYEDSYDDKKKQRAWKRFRKSYKALSFALRKIKSLAKAVDNGKQAEPRGTSDS